MEHDIADASAFTVAYGPAAALQQVEIGRASRRRIEVPWSAEEDTRLRRWLLWSTVVTLGLVGVLLAAAWMAAR